MGKWRGMLESDNALVRYNARQFIEMIAEADRVDEFDVDLYFALKEKMVVHDEGRLIVGLLDGTEVKCEIKWKGKSRAVSC